jgi:type VI secretion system protein ImpI/type VI secretion system protein
MEQLGAAFRAIVFGIRQALIARASIKSEFRIGQTMIRPRGNNPLKFSANDEDALAALLGAGRRTDISPEAAVSDALTDMRIHELATMTGMQSAVRALVARFSPEALRSAAERGGLKLLGGGKTRAWDAFEALHGQVSRGLSDDFDSVFGRSFTRAYEQAVAEIEARDKGR